MVSDKDRSLSKASKEASSERENKTKAESKGTGMPTILRKKKKVEEKKVEVKAQKVVLLTNSPGLSEKQ